ncbi:MAG: ATP-binding cassette domain-containing protein [Methanosarcinaceae archaeon]|nr:ATP-binding cassette domain-containing protein [Methanosarcinaceae archaeon]
MTEYAIDIQNLTRNFKELTAVDNVSLTVEKGELFGLLGPNGAGKTTIINMLSTMLKPTSGNATVWGADISSKPTRVRRSIGVVFQGNTLDDRLTGRENLDLHGRLYGLSKDLRSERITEVLELVELSERADEIVKTYSGGMMRRLEIARGLMHRPKVLFLDEPTLGLDPQTRNHIWDYIEKLNREENITMVLTTHYMEEADSLCKRIAIIDHGKISALGTPTDLKAQLGGDIITLTTATEDGATGLHEVCKELDLATDISISGSTIRITVPSGERAIPQFLTAASEKNFPIESVNLRKPTLDDVFLYHTGRAIRQSNVDEMDRMRFMMQSRKR